ncbi:hypothetical protein FBU59_002527 [Linderina macrospora]|uniref:Uncharacterized protein n=1 Tax=Linderina macrospora TaxID=4868 RepID=A0ACC1JB90_9FUNG|nr:hypothetical protein FBU59_002527 [Linderina macrospora]
MFGFRKSKGRRNIRKKDDSALEDDGTAVEIVKRSAKSTARSERTIGGSTGLSFGTETTPTDTMPNNWHENMAVNQDTQMAETHTPHAQDEGHNVELVAEGSKSEPTKSEPAPYPFATDGIPDAQQILQAKKLRRQRQAVELYGLDDEFDDDDEGFGSRNSQPDFISLSDNLAGSRISGPNLSNPYDEDDDISGNAAAEDEDDAVIIDKKEREQHRESSRLAKEQLIEEAQEASEVSDWENEQLRNAGVTSSRSTLKRQSHSRPKDTGSFKFDDSYMSFLLGQENGQLGIDEDRMKTLEKDIAQTAGALKDIASEMEAAQKQWDHFSTMAKSVV